MPVRQAVPGQFYQGVDEELCYTLDTSNWTTAPQTASAVIKQGASDKSASLFRTSGSTGATVSACTITTPCIVSLASAVDYRVEIMFEDNVGKKFETFFFIKGEL
jgi:hypothetical protein